MSPVSLGLRPTVPYLLTDAPDARLTRKRIVKFDVKRTLPEPVGASHSASGRLPI
jgi:hypothetical protein